MRRRGRRVESTRETFGEMLGGVRAVCANRQLWHVCAIQFVNYGSIIAIVGLWAGPYLNDVHACRASSAATCCSPSIS